MKRRLYPLTEAGDELGGLSKSTLYQLIRQGELKTVKVGNRTLVAGDELDRFVAERSGSER